MYDPPVEVKIDKADYYSIENEVLSVVQRAGIRVDRRELFRALDYDRGQYEKDTPTGALMLCAALWDGLNPALRGLKQRRTVRNEESI